MDLSELAEGIAYALWLELIDNKQAIKCVKRYESTMNQRDRLTLELKLVSYLSRTISPRNNKRWEKFTKNMKRLLPNLEYAYSFINQKPSLIAAETILNQNTIFKLQVSSLEDSMKVLELFNSLSLGPLTLESVTNEIKKNRKLFKICQKNASSQLMMELLK